MSKVVIDMSVSLDGFVAGPDDGKKFSLGGNGAQHIFDWFTSGGGEPVRYDWMRPAPGADRDETERMFADSGAYIFGRRTYDQVDGWGGSHPVEGVPVFILTHTAPDPASVPRGKSRLIFVADGIASAVTQAKAAAAGKEVKLGGASACQQALTVGLVDEILVHVAPHLMGAGVRLFDHLGGPVRLAKLSARDGALATHLRYRVLKE